MSHRNIFAVCHVARSLHREPVEWAEAGEQWHCLCGTAVARRTARIVFVLASLLIGLLAGAAAQVIDDPDIALHSPQRAPYGGGRSVDIAYARDGTLVAAYVARDSQARRPDRLVVKRSTDGGHTWQTLWNAQPRPGVERIENLAIDIASGFAGVADKQICIGAHVLDAQNVPWIDYYEGPYDRPWVYSPFVTGGTLPNIGMRPDPSAWVELSTAVISRVRQGPDQYIVGLAYSVAPSVGSTSQVFIDYVGGLGAVATGLLGHRVLAGPGGEIVDGSTSYTSPSLAYDVDFTTLGVAFDDFARDIVHVGTAFVGSDIPRFQHKWHTPENDSRPEHSPALAADPLGGFHLACLAGYRDFWNSYQLIAYEGVIGSSVFVELPMLHVQAQSTPDIAVREGLMVVAARCVVDPGETYTGSGVLAFTGPPSHRSYQSGAQIHQTILNDQGIGVSHPRLAITFAAESVAFSEDESGSIGESVFIDP